MSWLANALTSDFSVNDLFIAVMVSVEEWLHSQSVQILSCRCYRANSMSIGSDWLRQEYFHKEMHSFECRGRSWSAISCVSQLLKIPVLTIIDTQMIQMYPCQYADKTIHLIDTPGFDGKELS